MSLQKKTGFLRTKLELPMEEIYLKRETGMSYQQLSFDYDCSVATIERKLSEYCKENGKKRSKRIKMIQKTKFPVNEIYLKYKSGVSMLELARQYNIKYSTINIIIRDCYRLELLYILKDNLEIEKSRQKGL